jgi:transcriptional regulator with XRE-family HTH domain
MNRRIAMTNKPLFGDLIAAHKGLTEEIKNVDVVSDLNLLLHECGMSREDLASKLTWSDDRLSQVLSGHETISIQTVAAVAGALGYTFDLVFRKIDTSSILGASDEVRAKLAERHLTQEDVEAAVDWERTSR